MTSFEHDHTGPYMAGLEAERREIEAEAAAFTYPDDPPCNTCGGLHPDGDWSCPKLDPAPHGGRGDFHACRNRTDPYCQGECGG